jgi:SPX domain protein involved in polyphosphate accumulation
MINDIVHEKSEKSILNHDHIISFEKFNTLLQNNIDIMKQFIIRIKQYNQIDLEMINKKLKIQINPESESLLQNHLNCFKLQEEDLKMFIKVNTNGLRKLLKKHDKLTLGNPLLLNDYMKEWYSWCKENEIDIEGNLSFIK